MVRKVLEDKTFVLSQRIGRTPEQLANSSLCHGSSFFIQSGP